MFGLSKPIPKDKGAKLAQAQNQAPDSIPGMFKPGEFVLPPDTVHAMGGKQALQGVVDATHTPVTAYGLNAPRASGPLSKAAPQLGLKPEVFFANGGAPEDQLRRAGNGQASPSNTFPQASPSAGASIYSGAGLGRDQFGSSGQIAKVPDAIGQQPGRQLPAQAQTVPTAQPAATPIDATGSAPDAAGASQAAVTPPAGAPAAATRSPGPSELYMQDRTQEMRDQWGSGNYAQAAGTAARTAVQGLLGMYGIELADKVGSPVANAVGNFAGGLIGSDAHAAQSPAAQASAPGQTAATSTKPATSPTAPVAIQPGLTSTLGSAPRAAQPVTAASASGELPDGVYNHGRGQYSDQAGGMGFPAGFTGKPNAQNDAAAGALAQSGGLGLRRPAATPASEAPALGLYGGRGAEADSQPGWSGSIGQSSGNGNMWSRTPEQQRRDAETQASSIHRQTAANGRAALTALSNQELEGMRGTNALAQESMRQAGGLQRTAMTEAGATGRAALAESGANSRASGQLGLGLRRLSLDQQRAASDERLRAPQIRAAERLGQLQEAYVNAKTPEEQAAIASQMRAYSGKDEADWKVQVTPAIKNLDGSTTAGSVIRYNSRTGDVQEVGGVGGKSQVPAKDSLKAGQVYQTPRGQARWNGAEFELVS